AKAVDVMRRNEGHEVIDDAAERHRVTVVEIGQVARELAVERAGIPVTAPRAADAGLAAHRRALDAVGVVLVHVVQDRVEHDADPVSVSSVYHGVERGGASEALLDAGRADGPVAVVATVN